MQRMGYQAVNVGERDVRDGWERFARVTDGLKLRFTSANIVDKASGKPVLPGHVILDLASPDGSTRRRIGVIGVARFNPLFDKPGPDGTELAIVQPVDRVREELAAMAAESKGGTRVDMVVLLAALHRDDAKKIVDEVQGIDIVLGAYGGLYTPNPERAGTTWIVYVGNQGKRLGETRIFLGPDGGIANQTTAMHYMTQTYPGDPEMQAFVNSVVPPPAEPPAAAAPAAAASPPSVPPPPPRPAPTKAKVGPKVGTLAGQFVGSETCGRCHAEVHAGWTATPHASAFATLEREGHAADAECVGCHTTGRGHPGGFESAAATPAMENVGCESCHGAGRRHSARPRMPYGEVSVASCTACHDAANSPKFDYYTWLPQVSHRDAGAATGAPAR